MVTTRVPNTKQAQDNPTNGSLAQDLFLFTFISIVTHTADIIKHTISVNSKSIIRFVPHDLY